MGTALFLRHFGSRVVEVVLRPGLCNSGETWGTRPPFCTTENVKTSVRAAAFIRVHRVSSGFRKDYEMRKGFTRKPKSDEPATPVKNYITPSGLQRLKDEHRFLLTRERPAVTEVVAWAAGNGDRSEKRRLSVRQAAAAADRWADSLSYQANRSWRKWWDPEAPRAGQGGDEGILRSDRALCQCRGSIAQW